MLSPPGMQRLGLMLVLALGACAVARPVYKGDVRVADDKLVTIAPEVKTVADADKPVFFAHGQYWLFHDGQWWRARTLRGTYELEQRPPVAVRQITSPYEYTHLKKDRPAAVAAGTLLTPSGTPIATAEPVGTRGTQPRTNEPEPAPASPDPNPGEPSEPQDPSQTASAEPEREAPPPNRAPTDPSVDRSRGL